MTEAHHLERRYENQYNHIVKPKPFGIHTICHIGVTTNTFCNWLSKIPKKNHTKISPIIVLNGEILDVSHSIDSTLDGMETSLRWSNPTI